MPIPSSFLRGWIGDILLENAAKTPRLKLAIPDPTKPPVIDSSELSRYQIEQAKLMKQAQLQRLAALPVTPTADINVMRQQFADMPTQMYGDVDPTVDPIALQEQILPKWQELWNAKRQYEQLEANQAQARQRAAVNMDQLYTPPLPFPRVPEAEAPRPGDPFKLEHGDTFPMLIDDGVRDVANATRTPLGWAEVSPLRDAMNREVAPDALPPNAFEEAQARRIVARPNQRDILMKEGFDRTSDVEIPDLRARQMQDAIDSDIRNLEGRTTGATPSIPPAVVRIIEAPPEQRSQLVQQLYARNAGKMSQDEFLARLDQYIREYERLQQAPAVSPVTGEEIGGMPLERRTIVSKPMQVGAEKTAEEIRSEAPLLEAALSKAKTDKEAQTIWTQTEFANYDPAATQYAEARIIRTLRRRIAWAEKDGDHVEAAYLRKQLWDAQETLKDAVMRLTREEMDAWRSPYDEQNNPSGQDWANLSGMREDIEGIDGMLANLKDMVGLKEAIPMQVEHGVKVPAQGARARAAGQPVEVIEQAVGPQLEKPWQIKGGPDPQKRFPMFVPLTETLTQEQRFANRPDPTPENLGSQPTTDLRTAWHALTRRDSAQSPRIGDDFLSILPPEVAAAIKGQANAINREIKRRNLPTPVLDFWEPQGTRQTHRPDVSGAWDRERALPVPHNVGDLVNTPEGLARVVVVRGGYGYTEPPLKSREASTVKGDSMFGQAALEDINKYPRTPARVIPGKVKEHVEYGDDGWYPRRVRVELVEINDKGQIVPRTTLETKPLEQGVAKMEQRTFGETPNVPRRELPTLRYVPDPKGEYIKAGNEYVRDVGNRPGAPKYRREVVQPEPPVTKKVPVYDENGNLVVEKRTGVLQNQNPLPHRDFIETEVESLVGKHLQEIAQLPPVTRTESGIISKHPDYEVVAFPDPGGVVQKTARDFVQTKPGKGENRKDVVGKVATKEITEGAGTIAIRRTTPGNPKWPQGEVRHVPVEQAVKAGVITAREAQLSKGRPKADVSINEDGTLTLNAKGAQVRKLPMNFSGEDAKGGITSTFKRMWEGWRTGTTRKGWPGGVTPEKGDMYVVSEEGKDLLVRVTDRVLITKDLVKDPKFRQAWSEREGWPEETLNKHVGNFQTVFEVVGHRPSGSDKWLAGSPADRQAEMQNRVAVIGTAGRDKMRPLTKDNWDAMKQDLYNRVGPNDILVSGGAAWADHLAVQAFLEGRVAGLELHLPAPFKGGRFADTPDGKTANYYHDQFQKATGIDGRREILDAYKKGAVIKTNPKGFKARNADVANNSGRMVAYTLGEGPEPADGGTADTWRKAGYSDKVHVPISLLGTAMVAAAVGANGSTDSSQKFDPNQPVSEAGIIPFKGASNILRNILGKARVPTQDLGELGNKAFIQQHAPVRDVPTPAREYSQMQSQLFNSNALVEDVISRFARKRGLFEKYNIPDREDPHYTYGPRVRGGMAPSAELEDRAIEITKNLPPVIRDEYLPAYLTYFGASREWHHIADKISRINTEIANAERRGDEKAAEVLRRQHMGMFTKMADLDVLPDKMTGADVAKQFAALKARMSPEDLEQTQYAAMNLMSVVNEMVDYMHTKGVITPKEYAYWNERGQYMPLYRIMTVFDPAAQEQIRVKHTTKGIPVPSMTRLSLSEDKVIDEMTGSSRMFQHPLVAIGNFLESAGNEIQRNRVARDNINFLMKIKDDMKDIFFIRESSDSEKVPAEGFTKISYLENGKPKYYMVDSDLGKALDTVDPESMRVAFRMGQSLRLMFHAMAATAFPGFAAVQVAKDPISGVIMPDYNRYQRLAGKGVLSRNLSLASDILTSYAPAFAQTLLRNYGSKLQNMPVLGGIMPKIDAPSDKMRMGNRWSEFQKSGAAGSPLGTVRMGVSERMLGFTPTAPTVLGRAAQYVKHGVDKGVDVLLSPLEESVKYASYRTLRKRGYDAIPAAAETRKFGGSPDFHRYGNAVKKAQNMYMFIAPQMSGISRFLEKAQDNPKQLVKWATLFGAMAAATFAHNMQYKDDEGELEITKIPRDKLQNNFIWLLPDGDYPLIGPAVEELSIGNKRRKALVLPMAHEVQALLSPMISVMSGMIDPKQFSVAQTGLDAASNLLPGGGRLKADDLVGSAVRRVIAGLNPALKYPIEATSGWNMLLNAPIVGRRTADRMPSEQFTQRTDPTAKAIAQGVSKVPGLGKVPIINSPDRLQHLITSFLPGLGEMGLTLGQLALPRGTEQTGMESKGEQFVRTPGLGPVFRRFLDVGSTDQNRLDLTQEVYNLADRTRRAATTISGESTRTPGRLQELLKDRQLQHLASLNPELSNITKELAEIDQARELMMTDTSVKLSPDTRKLILRNMWLAENKMLKQFTQAMEDLKKRGVIQ